MTSVTCLEQRIGLGTPADPPRGYAREAVTGVHSVTAVSAPRINVSRSPTSIGPDSDIGDPAKVRKRCTPPRAQTNEAGRRAGLPSQRLEESAAEPWYFSASHGSADLYRATRIA